MAEKNVIQDDMWKQLLSNVNWKLQARTSNVWFDTTGLSIVYVNRSNMEKKFNIILDLHDGDPTADYRMNMSINKQFLSWNFDNVNHVIFLHYSEYDLRFNYSDIFNVNGLIFNHGVINSKIWFTITRLDVPDGHYELDPVFNITNAHAAAMEFNNKRAFVVSSNGTYHIAFFNNTGVVYGRSFDAGTTWTFTYLNATLGYTRPTIAIDSHDYLNINFANDGFGATLIVADWRSTDGGNTWTFRNIGVGNYRGYYASSAVDSNDNLVVAWLGYSATYPLVRVGIFKIRWYGNSTWSSVKYFNTVAISYGPAIAFDEQNLLHIVYTPASRYVYYRYYNYTSGVLSSQRTVHDAAAAYAQYVPSIIVNSTNGIHVVWYGRYSVTGNQLRIGHRQSNNNGSSWSALDVVSSYNTYQYEPTIGLDKNSTLTVVWFGHPSAALTTYNLRISQRPVTSTSWSASVNLTTDTTGYRFSTPNILSSLNPTTNGIRKCIPQSGYAFIYCNDSGLWLWKSSDFKLSDVPTQTLISPVNGSTIYTLTPTVSLWANDSDGNLLTVHWFENSTGAWIKRQTNNSVPHNSVVRWVFSQASSYNVTYYFRVHVVDLEVNISRWYYFTLMIRPWITGVLPGVGTPYYVGSVMNNLTFNATCWDYFGNTIIVSYWVNGSFIFTTPIPIPANTSVSFLLSDYWSGYNFTFGVVYNFTINVTDSVNGEFVNETHLFSYVSSGGSGGYVAVLGGRDPLLYLVLGYPMGLLSAFVLWNHHNSRRRKTT